MAEISTHTTGTQSLADAVAQGLKARPKTLPSWLFYDEKGDELFRQIMRTPEYYPTRCEYDILQKHKEDLREHFEDQGRPFTLIELGAGDGLKTEILLKHFVDTGTDFTYMPVDISLNAVQSLARRLRETMTNLRIEPKHSTYDEVLSGLRATDEKKVLLFMGANIGNFVVQTATDFLKKLARAFTRKDMLLIGFDLMKDPRIIQEAYDDPKGLTAAFNMNLLTRINRELGAQFDTNNFSHYPYYDPVTGANRSFLMSMKDQDVYIESLDWTVHFDRWETIQTEISQKYDIAMINKMMALTGLEIIEYFYDNDRYFTDVLLRGS